MTEPNDLTLKFKIFQKVELIDLSSERLIYVSIRVVLILGIFEFLRRYGSK